MLTSVISIESSLIFLLSSSKHMVELTQFLDNKPMLFLKYWQ